MRLDSSPLTSKLRLCLALLVASLFTNLTDPSAYRRIWRAISLWWGALEPDSTVSDYLRTARLNVCRNCPLFFRPLQTCGTPLRKELRELGCWCNMESKSKLADATCWIDDELPENKHGWISHGLGQSLEPIDPDGG